MVSGGSFCIDASNRSRVCGALAPVVCSSILRCISQDKDSLRSSWFVCSRSTVLSPLSRVAGTGLQTPQGWLPFAAKWKKWAWRGVAGSCGAWRGAAGRGGSLASVQQRTHCNLRGSRDCGLKTSNKSGLRRPPRITRARRVCSSRVRFDRRVASRYCTCTCVPDAPGRRRKHAG